MKRKILAIIMISVSITIIPAQKSEISAPLAQKFDLAKIKDPLKKIDVIQIGLTGANTQVFDGRDLVKSPPSMNEFGRWEQPLFAALEAIHQNMKQLDTVATLVKQINSNMKDFFKIMSRNKEDVSSTAPKYKKLAQDQLAILAKADTTFDSFSAEKRKKLTKLEKSVLGKLKKSKIQIERATLTLMQVIIETLRANLNKMLK